jgi:hypothetical protein
MKVKTSLFSEVSAFPLSRSPLGHAMDLNNQVSVDEERRTPGHVRMHRVQV